MPVNRKPYRGATDLANRRITVYRGRRVRVEFEMNRAGIQRIALGPAIRDAVRQVVVREALPFAIRNSPRGERDEADLEAAFVNSWRVTEGTVFLVGMERASAKLINVSPHAAAVEFINPKTGKGHGYGVLAKTLAHLNGVALGEAARSGGKAKRPFNPQQHPRGARGRFVRKNPPAGGQPIGQSLGADLRKGR